MRVSDFNFNVLRVYVFAAVVSVTACVDRDFDAPPGGGTDPGLTPTLTIAELRAMHTLGQYEQIATDEIIRGIVISDDEEGNFFKQLVIQDETGGIEMRIDVTDLFTQYPPGRQVYVNLKDLWLGDYNGLVQLGAAVTGSGNNRELVRIPETLLGDILLKGSFGHQVQPAVLTINQLNPSYVSTLVQLEDVQFAGADAGVPYADAVNELTVNRTIMDCSNRQTILRTSGFSTFAAALTPTGKGTLVGVLGIFGTDMQFAIRDLDDVRMEDGRCGSGGATLTIQALRDAFAGGAGMAPAGEIKGVVISDRTSNNINNRNLYLQDATAGIVVRFNEAHGFALGAELTIDVTGQELSEFRGLLQVNNVPNGNAVSPGAGALPSPRLTSVVEVLNNVEAWESTRVKLEKVTLSGNATFSGNITVTDASGAMVLFTNSNAAFASTALPQGEVDLIAFVSYFDVPQLLINSASDVTGGDPGNGGNLDESFTSIANNTDIALQGWLNIAVKGSRLWRAQVFDVNHYAQATAFNDAATEMETWLVTPAIDVSKPKWLSFVTAQAFWVHDGLSVLASTDFNGSDIGAATWTPVSAAIATQTDDDHAWVPSGDIDLEQFSSPVRIAFRYVGSGPGGQTTSYRVDDVLVRDK